MNKLFKKITAAAMAAVITSSALALYANAASEEKTFSTRHVNSPTYIPSEVNYAAEVRLEASTEQYTGTITYMSDIVSRSATITCTSHTFYDTILPIEFNTTGSRKWRISGRIGDGVKAVYKVSARTNIYGTLNVEGKISREGNNLSAFLSSESRTPMVMRIPQAHGIKFYTGSIKT